MNESIWSEIQVEALEIINKEPILADYFQSTILEKQNFFDAIAKHLSNKIHNSVFAQQFLYDLIIEIVSNSISLQEYIIEDFLAIKKRDPAAISDVSTFLNYKGFHSIVLYRVSNYLWKNSRKEIALFIQSIISEKFAVDIHPAAQIGRRVFIDHATSIVIGETAVIGNDVSMLHEVTLGGTGNDSGDRHPKVGNGVLIGAGAKILGNITIGDGAKIGAGSVVLSDVQKHTTVVGIPARRRGKPKDLVPSIKMNHKI